MPHEKKPRADVPTTAGDRITIDGVLEHIAFRSNNGSGWGVAEFTDAEGRRRKVAGKIDLCEVGKSYRFAGREEHNRYGTTLKATSILPVVPRGTAGVRSYLETLPGIGEVSAAALVAAKGPDEVLSFLESAILEDIRAAGAARLTAEKLDELRTVMAGEREHREADLQLREMLGDAATDSLLRKIRDQWGDRAVMMIRSSPWILTDLPGIGFMRADAIAQRLGVDLDHPDRLRAAVLFVIEDMRGDGHTKFHSTQLVQMVTSVLGLAEESSLTRATRGIVLLIEDEKLRECDPEWLQLASDAENEAEIARMLRKRLDPAAVRDATPFFDADPPSNLMADQVDALDVLASAGPGGTAILTGAPGTGKTTMVKSFFPRFASIALCAPTGKAAKRLSEQAGRQATTIHRLLEPMPREDSRGKMHFDFGRDEQNPIDADLLVVDEASMVDASLFRRLLRAVPPSCYLLIVGDPNQLPSVSPGAVLRDLIESNMIPHAQLTQIKRTNPGLLLRTIHGVKDGRWPLLRGNDPAADLFIMPAQTEESAVAMMADLYLTRLPKMLPQGASPIMDIQLLVPWKAKDGMSARTVNLEIQRRRVESGAVQLLGKFFIGVGDKVIQMKNDYERNIVNGDQGIVRDMTQTGENNQWHYVVEFVGYDEHVTIPAVGNDLELAYAVTVHKSQGSEWPIVVLPAVGTQSQFYDRCLFYTALSRAQRMAVVVGKQDGLPSVVGRVGAQNRRTNLASLLIRKDTGV